MHRGWCGWLLVTGGVWLWVSCGLPDDDPPEEIAERSAALHLMFDIEDAGAVESAELSISPCEDDRMVASKEAAATAWGHQQLTPSYVGENRLFLEEYRRVAAGCYDVELRLFGAGKTRSGCTAGVGRDIDVESDSTAEVVLYSRCGEKAEPPSVEMIEFEPTAFPDCHQPIDVCATVDGGGSTVDVSWSHREGPPVETDLEIGSRETESDRQIHCARWRPADRGEIVGSVNAYPAWAETTDGGETVLFSESHRALFSLFVECPPSVGMCIPEAVEQRAYTSVAAGTE